MKFIWFWEGFLAIYISYILFILEIYWILFFSFIYFILLVFWAIIIKKTKREERDNLIGERDLCWNSFGIIVRIPNVVNIKYLLQKEKLFHRDSAAQKKGISERSVEVRVVKLSSAASKTAVSWSGVKF